MNYDPNRYIEYKLRKQALAKELKEWLPFSKQDIKDLWNTGNALLLGAAGAGGIAAGYALSRASSPAQITKNSDLEIVRNNLLTEIATVQRQLDAEKKKYEEEKKAAKERRPYDRFLN